MLMREIRMVMREPYIFRNKERIKPALPVSYSGALLSSYSKSVKRQQQKVCICRTWHRVSWTLLPQAPGSHCGQPGRIRSVRPGVRS